MSISTAGSIQRLILHCAAVASIGLLAACNNDKTSAGNGAKTAADNSGINERDQQARTMTPFDQSQSPGELARVATLRSALMALPELSMAGQNIKIITSDGRVTLRGPVADKAERTRIEQALGKAAGQAVVDSQLEIAAAP